MLKRTRKNQDANVTAFQITQHIIEETEKPEPEEPPKNPNAVALGRLGGLKGGKARTDSMTPEQRSELARKAAKARWAKQDNR